MLLFNLLTSASSSVANTGNKNPIMWVVIGLFAVVLIVMMIFSNRSNKKRQKEAEEKLNNMRVGDRVKTIGGICGVVVEINDEENTFVLETGVENKGSLIKFDKVAVYQTSHPEEVQEESAEASEEQASAEPVEEAAAEAADVAEVAEVAEAVDEEVAENAEKTE